MRSTGTIDDTETAATEATSAELLSLPRSHRPRSMRGVSIAAAVVQFAILGVAAFTVVALVAGSRVRSSGNEEAIRDAREWASLISDDVVGPRITPELMAGDPAAIAELDKIVRGMVENGPVTRVKVWTPEGKIVYSDDHDLIGQTFTLEPAVIDALRTEQPVISVAQPEVVENELDVDDGSGHQLEVYMPFRLASGEWMLYEHYQHESAVSAGAEVITATFSPVVLKSLIALELIQLPLAWWLARRVRATQRQRAMLLQRALDASDDERRRIAADLHDGVVQDLAGMSFSVDAVRHDPLVRSDPAIVSTLDRVVDEAQKSIRSLRTLLVDIYPPSLDDGDLVGALNDLLTPLQAAGVRTEFVDTVTGTLSPLTHGLLYRAARESLKNVERHAAASSVRVVMRDGDEHEIVMEIIDDGCGFDVAARDERPADGHFGVRMLRDLVRAADGDIVIDSAPGRGTVVRMWVPR
ncbi:MAG: sensor histidine kinase [Actinobacteria bacterium]|nr:sensor histidine kinase [Actinomycetota bacterium]